MGRLWQTLILAQWNPIFSWIPVETIIHANQYNYYSVLSKAERTADTTEFIVFILQALEQAIDKELAKQPGPPPDGQEK
ncbi:MAG: hypothetical protein J6Y94_03225 [Bacteriovoracaceae bacterium]|nr:hypothetical protein [Bacteriovoracaceae bacterium]